MTPGGQTEAHVPEPSSFLPQVAVEMANADKASDHKLDGGSSTAAVSAAAVQEEERMED